VAWAHDWVSDPTLTPLFQALPGASFIAARSCRRTRHWHQQVGPFLRA
jgi:hypothetical protein